MAKLRGGGPYVFVSYAHADADYVRKLISTLKDHSIRHWFDEQRLWTGDSFDDDIEQAIKDCSGLLWVVTPASRESDYVKMEVKEAEAVGVKIWPLLVEGEPSMKAKVKLYEDLRKGRLPSDEWLLELRDRLQASTFVSARTTATAPPGPGSAVALDGDGALAHLVVGAGDVQIIRTDDPLNLRATQFPSPIEHLLISPDGSLVALQGGDGVRFAEVASDGGLSVWDLELAPGALGADPSDRTVSILALNRSLSRFDPSAELLVTVSGFTHRVRVDRRGRFRRLPVPVQGSFETAAALAEGFLLVRTDGGMASVGPPLEDFLAGGNWVDVDVAVGAGDEGVVTVAAALRIVDGDPHLIVWRSVLGGHVELRGIDLTGDPERLCVVRPRAGGAPDQILVTGGDRQLGWNWSDLPVLDRIQFVSAGAA